MGEVTRIEDQLRRAFEGNAWHGPAVRTLLRPVTAEQAAARPVPGAHSIWEIVLHMAAWEDVVTRRLLGEWIASLPDAEDWPSVPDAGAGAWEVARRRLDETHEGLRRTVAALEEARLNEPTPERDYTVYVMLHGVVQHDLYHAGQIALLKRSQV